MRIAVLGWGGLLFERWRFREPVEWKKGGVEIPIGISAAERSFLAFDPLAGERKPTHYVITTSTTLDDVLRALADRDDLAMSSVGFVNGELETASDRLGGFAAFFLHEIRAWASAHDVDAVVWRWNNPPAVTFH